MSLLFLPRRTGDGEMVCCDHLNVKRQLLHYDGQGVWLFCNICKREHFVTLEELTVRIRQLGKPAIPLVKSGRRVLELP